MKYETSFEPYYATRRPRNTVARGHAVKVDTVKIGGTDGKPTSVRYPEPAALCGAKTGTQPARYEAPVNCPACISKLRRYAAGNAGYELAKAANDALEARR
jgi:hypothetical protein